MHRRRCRRRRHPRRRTLHTILWEVVFRQNTAVKTVIWKCIYADKSIYKIDFSLNSENLLIFPGAGGGGYWFPSTVIKIFLETKFTPTRC